ncbi:Ger(x)C family spore germination protein [Paenibacillus koleovorans]|uniref:Ger(x)C family spore germination protein n=1 Tax=Paenibacillus koleovorans TaxID=121608 RepID=UPI000FDA5F5B|nr:Ger(x)C family spore germination protein [Paenibacillus koleovorans]
MAFGKTAVLVYMSAIVVLLGGCADKSIIDKIQLAQTLSVDLDGESGGVKNTVLFSNFERNDQVRIEQLTTRGDNFINALPKMNIHINAPIEYGHLKMMLFGKSLAEKGLETVLPSLCRDPEIGSWLLLGVTETEASEALRKVQANNIPYYLYDMVTQNIKNGNLPEMNFHTFINSYFSPIQDVMLPYLKVEDDGVRLDGIALFRENKYVTRIDMRDAFLLKLLLTDSKKGRLLVPMVDEETNKPYSLLLTSVHSDTDYKLTATNPLPALSIQVRLNAQIRDYPFSIHLTDSGKRKEVERQIEQFLVKQIKRFIAFLQEHRVDPVGFGNIVRSRDRSFQPNEFQDHYPQMKTDVSVKVNIRLTGLGD